MKNEKHEDGWELGSGKNYSINELYEIFKAKFNCACEYIPDQPGNYLSTLQLNQDAQKRLGYKPKDRLAQYINNLPSKI